MKLFGCKHYWIQKGKTKKAYALTEKGKKIPILFLTEYKCHKCGETKISTTFTTKELYKLK